MYSRIQDDEAGTAEARAAAVVSHLQPRVLAVLRHFVASSSFAASNSSRSDAKHLLHDAALE